MNTGALIAVAGVLGIGAYFMTRHISSSGVDMLKGIEEFRSEPYLDQAGIWTIGYGHRILPNEHFTSITEQQATEILKKDVASAEGAIRTLVKVKLSQQQFDALVLFVFNIGNAAFAASTLLKKLNAGDYTGAMDEFTRWKYITVDGVKKVSNGLLARREREAALFAAGTQVA